MNLKITLKRIMRRANWEWQKLINRVNLKIEHRILQDKYCTNLIKRFYQVLPMESVLEHCKKTGNEVVMIDDIHKYPALMPCTLDEFEQPGGGTASDETLDAVAYPLYFAHMDDVYAMADEEIIFHGGKALIDFVDYDPSRACRCDGISRFYTEIVIRKACISKGRLHVRRHIDSGILLTRTYWNNFFHFTFEGLASLWILYQTDEYKDYPIIVDSQAMNNPWNVKMLHLVVPERQIVQINMLEGTVCINHAIVLSRIAWSSQAELRRYVGWHMYRDAASFIKQRIFACYQARKSYDKVYVARGDEKRLLNETKLILMMKSMGFTIIDPIKNTFEDFLDVFFTASILVGVSGTNMVDLAFSKSNASIYIIVPYEFHHDVMSGLGYATNHRIRYIKAEPHVLKEAMPGTTFEVNLDYVRTVLADRV